jgi:hypothetical protein
MQSRNNANTLACELLLCLRRVSSDRYERRSPIPGIHELGVTALPAREAGNSRLSQVAGAVENAALRTGVNFAYLMQKAVIESGSNPEARSKTSSAAGLFQFTNQTWLRMIKGHGAEYGLGAYASQIQVERDGTAYVSDPAMRQAILDLRMDPQVSAEMAGELDKDNGAALQRNTGVTPGPTELYLAHFLGASGASELLNTMRANPNATAADILPRAASANPSIFYTADGQPRTVGEIYSTFAEKLDPTSLNTMAGLQPSYARGIGSPLTAPVNASSAFLLANLALQQMELTSMATILSADDPEENSSLSVMV